MISDLVKLHMSRKLSKVGQIKAHRRCSSNGVTSADRDFRETRVITAPLKAADTLFFCSQESLWVEAELQGGI